MKKVYENCRNYLYVSSQEMGMDKCPECGGFDAVVGHVQEGETEEEAVRRVSEELYEERMDSSDLIEPIKLQAEDMFLFEVNEERIEEMEALIKKYRALKIKNKESRWK